MGITIHYQGHINDMALLPDLVGELKAACRRAAWPYQEINERIIGIAEWPRCVPGSEDENTFYVVTDVKPVDDRWQGLAILPPECETLYLTFNRVGRLIVYDTRFNAAPGTYLVNKFLSCKTQFSSPETHIVVCNLLRLAQPYMAEWHVDDEGNYWESGDEQDLRNRWAEMDEIIQRLGSGELNQELGDILGEKFDGKIEIGKQIDPPPPLWRKDWGQSAHEN
jgi:hypothetical protein